MALDTNVLEAAAYLTGAAGILYIALSAPRTVIAFRFFLFAAFGLFLFLAFKNGFVRNGKHALIAGSAILIAAVALGLVARSRLNGVVITIALATMVYIHQDRIGSWRELAYGHLIKSYADFYAGVADRLDGSIRKTYQAKVEDVGRELPLPALTGGVDIYSYGQGYLLASGNRWTPRPVIQGHEAYTPMLERLNSEFLRGSGAPDTILFRVETIDDRLPSLEDGPSWPILLQAYRPQRLQDNYVFLGKSGPADDFFKSEAKSDHSQLGARYPLTPGGGAVFAQIEIRPTLLGRLLSLVYKPTLLHISLELADGSKRTYRLPSGLAAAGFLISPVVENSREFALLFGDRAYLAKKAVKSIAIDNSAGGGVFWQNEYEVKLRNIDVAPSLDMTTTLVFDPFISQAKITEAYGPAVKTACEGSIDAVNAEPQGATITHVVKTIAANGWLTVSGKDGAVPDLTFLTLTDQRGATQFLKAGKVSRLDLADYFHRKEDRLAGFEVFADVTDLKGKFTVGLARINAGRLEICEQQKRPITINERDQFAEAAGALQIADEPSASVECAAAIDNINGSAVSDRHVIASGKLSLGGWMVISGADGTTPDEIFVTLKQQNGQASRVGAFRTPRPDVNAHFNNPNLNDPGFQTSIDVSNLRGAYTLGLARKFDGKVEACSQIAVPIEVRAAP